MGQNLELNQKKKKGKDKIGWPCLKLANNESEPWNKHLSSLERSQGGRRKRGGEEAGPNSCQTWLVLVTRREKRGKGGFIYEKEREKKRSGAATSFGSKKKANT